MNSGNHEIEVTLEFSCLFSIAIKFNHPGRIVIETGKDIPVWKWTTAVGLLDGDGPRFLAIGSIFHQLILPGLWNQDTSCGGDLIGKLAQTGYWKLAGNFAITIKTLATVGIGYHQILSIWHLAGGEDITLRSVDSAHFLACPINLQQ